jgi:thiol-disulfide isomerase/thioredoxin
MGNGMQTDQHNARQTSAQQKIAMQRASQQQRYRMFMVGGAVLGVLVIIGVIVGVKVLGSNKPAPASTGHVSGSASSSVTGSITSVPSSTLDSVGAGTSDPVQPTHGQPLLTSGGKPEVLYIGAEYCPYCAAERWAMAVALSRFGTFSGLHYIHSSSTDVYPNTPTLSFYGSTYTSKYLAFTPVEWYSVTHAVLQTPTSAQMALFNKYDAPPYVPSGDNGSFPFVDIGNQSLIIGSQYEPSVFAGMTWSQVAAAIRNPSTAIAKDVNGAANQIDAQICKITGGQPGSVCNSAGVKAAAATS